MPLLGQYKYIIDKTHPRANSEGAVYEHIIAAEQKLNRPLLPEEVVHHKDLNKLNNNPENILVFASNGDHSRFHSSGCNENLLVLTQNGSYECEKIKYRCVDCGVETSRYKMRCKKCSSKQSRKAERPQSDELYNLLAEHNGNFTKISKLYGVTDNSVRKWCDSYNIPRSSRYYKQANIAMR